MTGGFNNITIGYQSGTSIITSNDNIAIGAQAMNGGTNPYNGIGIGTSANGNSGNDNIAIGRDALAAGNFHNAIAIGLNSMVSGAFGDIAIGTSAINVRSDGDNIGIGAFSLNALTSPGATHNIALGYQALTNAASPIGSRNVAIGYQAIHAIPSNDSIALGSNVTIQRDNEFRISDLIQNVNLGVGFAGQAAAGTKVFNDNTDAIAVGGLVAGDLYVVGGTGAPPAPPGSAAVLAVVY